MLILIVSKMNKYRERVPIQSLKHWPSQIAETSTQTQISLAHRQLRQVLPHYSPNNLGMSKKFETNFIQKLRHKFEFYFICFTQHSYTYGIELGMGRL